MTGPATAAARFVKDNPAEAAVRLRTLLQSDEHNAEAWRLLGRALRRLGHDEEAAEAEMSAIRSTAFDAEMIEIAGAMSAGDLPRAEALLRARLREEPFDVAAIRLMAELAGRLGRLKDAEALLRRALELAPGFVAARANLATVLYRENRFAEAVAALEEVVAAGDAKPANANLMAAALGRIGDFDEAIRIYEDLLPVFGEQPKLLMSYGHALKTVGRQEESVDAYRRSIAAKPDFGEVWWSLANLKTVRFSDQDVAAMERALQDAPEREDQLHLHFALGKAYADSGEVENSFRHYAAGNALRKLELGHAPGVLEAQIDKVIATFTAEFFSIREGWGDPSPDPIFIVGLPRAGSTLIEQILSCHSQIEGTMELPDLPAIAQREGRDRAGDPRHWPEAMAMMDAARAAELGAEFLERTRVQRKTAKPFYIDKLPNNWAYVGLIQLILPNAKVIDARRHPLDCCFSNFRQHFAKGQAFTYDLEHIGRYYADYARAMDHFDRILQGRVHRVIHEELLDDPETVVRGMLDYIGLSFEDACLEFHASRRPVRTASSEQVRRPLNREGVDQWRPFEPWLGPLKQALGDLPETYASRH